LRRTANADPRATWKQAVAAAAAAGALWALSGCDRGGARPDADAAADAPLPWDVAEPEPEPRPGMAWIPPGVLIAGTPPDRLPRVADEEMAGEQVIMRGFYVDVFPYPNEVGAIPTTGVTQDEARGLCEAQGKRLCTELELERACKGPGNTAYEYGDAYKPSVCATGLARSLIPNGVNASCASAFGVHDLHGGSWTWTSSQWRRDPSKQGLVTVRGGNGPAGELIGRCANGRGVKAEARRPDVGVRCCAGEVNSFEVVLEVTRGQPLRLQPLDDRIAPQLEQLAPEEVRAAVRSLGPDEQFKVERLWVWHPLGNEELVVGGGCAHPAGKAICGLVIARMRYDTAILLAFVPSDWWTPTLGETDTARELFLYGGDHAGAFRKRVSYEWGRIAAAEKERKRKHKGQREPAFD
jgi:formylglycine-generating enzyme required for sulfatase activity